VVELIVDIQWEGPYPLSALGKLSDPARDRGLYQIYGHHPVYGQGALLYIGKALEQTFGLEIPTTGFGNPGGNEDTDNVEVYVGRLKGEKTPELWRRESTWQRSS
jgi:hypothetical protein